MKFKIFLCSFALVYSIISSGCATIIKGGEGSLYLQNAPKDIEVFEDGEKLDVELLEDTQAAGFGDAFKDEMNNTSTTYYSYGVTLKDPSLPRQLVFKSESLGKEAEVNIETHFRFLWFALDLFTTGAIGIIVDAANGNWNEFAGEGDDLKYVNVLKHMNGDTAFGQ